MSRYYVYMLIDPRDESPFYVGKGCGQRAYLHTKRTKNGKSSENRFKDRVIQKIIDQKLEPLVLMYRDSLDEIEAYDLEEETIRCFGRRGIDEGGILTNRRISSRAPLVVNRVEQKSWNKGKTYELHSEAYKRRLCDEMLGASWNDRFGNERATNMKQAASDRLRGISLSDRLGEDKAQQQKDAIRLKLTGRTLEELIGLEAAERGRASRKDAALAETSHLKATQFKPGEAPWKRLIAITIFKSGA
jgi:hypothetical protein